MGERDHDPAVDHLCPGHRLTIVERQEVVVTLKALAAGAGAGIAANVTGYLITGWLFHRYQSCTPTTWRPLAGRSTSRWVPGCASGRSTPSTSMPEVWSHSGARACWRARCSGERPRDTAIIRNSSVFAPMQRRLLPSTATCERWPLRQRCAGIHSIDARLVGAGAVSYSAQPEGSLLMNGSIFCANCERAIQGFTPGGAGTYVRHLTHSLRSLREVSRLGNGGGYGATAGSDRSPHIVEPDK